MPKQLSIYIIPKLKDVKGKEKFLKEARRVKRVQITHKEIYKNYIQAFLRSHESKKGSEQNI